jgi:hypothetical protein
VDVLTPLKNFTAIIYFFDGQIVGKQVQAVLVCGLLAVCFQFLGASAKLRKATVSFIVSVHLHAWNNLAPTGLIFMKSDI